MKFNWRPATIGLALLTSVFLPGTVLAQQLPDVPRDKTLVILASTEAPVFRNVGMVNPYNINIQDIRQSAISAFEPLFYYNSNKDELIPWLATGYKFDEASDAVTLTLRDGVKWSDGEAFNADDVVFTYSMLIENGKGAKDLLHAPDIAEAVASVEKIDDLTVRFKLTHSDPRFATKFLHNYFDIGLQIVPEHIWSKVKDKASFANFDLEKGWPVVTGPWKVSRFTDSQIFLDRRHDYWGSATGFTNDPAVERVITVPGGTTDRMAQLLVTNQADITGDLQSPTVIEQVLKQNPKITTFSGRDRPFGAKDWWPTSLYFNHLNPKWADVRVRRAINHYVNSDQVINVIFDGASEKSFTPFPGFGALQPYIDAVTPLAVEKGIGVYDAAAGDALMTEAGYTKDADGFWAKDGVELTAAIEAISSFNTIGPVVAEQLRRGGINATFRSSPESRAIMRDGKYDLTLFGHRGSIADPYDTLAMYTCANALPEGEPTLFVSRWCNKEYDALVAKIASIPPGDPALVDAVKKAMAVWIDDAVEVPIQEWYHRVPMNQTYWTNWPSAENPYMQPSYWYTSGQFGYVLHQLKAAE